MEKIKILKEEFLDKIIDYGSLTFSSRHLNLIVENDRITFRPVEK